MMPTLTESSVCPSFNAVAQSDPAGGVYVRLYCMFVFVYANGASRVNESPNSNAAVAKLVTDQTEGGRNSSLLRRLHKSY